MELFVVWLASLIIGTIYGNSKGQVTSGFIWTFLFGPLGLLVIVFLPNVAKANDAELKNQQSLLTLARMKHEGLTRFFLHEQPLLVSRRFDSADLSSAIAIHDEAQRITLVSSRGGGGFVGSVFPFSAIIGARVVEDGATIQETRTDRNSQAAGILVGELLGGSTGALIGGLSAKKISTTSRFSTSIELHVMVDSFDQPLWKIVFSQQTLEHGCSEYLRRKEAAQQWEAILQVLMRKGSRRLKDTAVIASARSHSTPPPPPPPLPAPPVLVSRPASSANGFYYLDLDWQTTGPVTISEMIRLVQQGTVGLDTLICAEGYEDWRKLGDVLQL